jgi:Brp/Blh family beta-carotene 15,15'-monooxygenase
MSGRKYWLALHRRLATIWTAAAFLPLFFLFRDIHLQVVFFIFNVALFGISHGAVDHLRCPPDKKGKVGIFRLLSFGVLYIGFSFLVLYVWLHDPGPMLVSFLLLSCLHFAMDEDEALPFAEKFLWGSLPVLAPCFLHAKAVGEMFSFLTGAPGDFSLALNTSLRLIGYLLLGLAVASLVVDTLGALEERSKNRLAVGASELLLLSCYLFLPPLLSFTIYFCWWHSIRQCLKLIAEFDATDFRRGLVAFARSALPLTLGSWLMACFLYLMVASTSSAQQFALQIRTVFYLLSALTVPHMFVEIMLSNRLFRSTQTRATS